MATFKLQPCKVREDHLVPTKDEVVSLSWTELVEHLAPSGSYKARLTLRNLKKGAYVGLLRNAKNPSVPPGTFFVHNPGSSNNIKWILNKDPFFSERVVQLYRVLEAEWDYEVEEFSGSGSRSDIKRGARS